MRRIERLMKVMVMVIVIVIMMLMVMVIVIVMVMAIVLLYLLYRGESGGVCLQQAVGLLLVALQSRV
jgi:hypothetical protein